MQPDARRDGVVALHEHRDARLGRLHTLGDLLGKNFRTLSTEWDEQKSGHLPPPPENDAPAGIRDLKQFAPSMHRARRVQR